jgi:hypothetical protein
MPNACPSLARHENLPKWQPLIRRSVKPSAQPTLVRTQHLPPAEVAGHDWYAKIARPLKVSGVQNRRLSLRRFESSTWRHHPN